MARTLQQLKESVERLIQEQGANAPVAAWIYTKEDVFELDEDYNPIALSPDETEHVLNEVEDGDYIHEQIAGLIDDEIRRLKIVDVLAKCP